jgi:predicted nuclease with TOPRIM domain
MSKPKVQRWECECNEFGDADMQKNNIGNYVRYEDYVRLKAERDAIHSSKLVYFIHGEGRWANIVEENARLKAQIDAKMEVGVPYADYERLFAENARLKAEVERLTERNQFLEQIDSYLQEGINIENEERCIELEAQVERLTKAGDELEKRYFEYATPDNAVKAWHAAKGGKQP